MRILLFGATGWIGQKMLPLLSEHEVITTDVRLNSSSDLGGLLDLHKPSHVLNCAGITGRPNIDQCEEIKTLVLETNVVGTARLAMECDHRGIHNTHLATGCIFEYDDTHPIPDKTWNGRGFPGRLDDDKPNFDKSFYSFSKIMTENILRHLPTSLILRLRMPITGDFHSRNFITKILNYSKVCSMPNSMSVLNDLLPLIPDLMTKKTLGIINFVNPGVIAHNDILDLYAQIVDPTYTYANFTVEEQSKVLKAGRSNTALACDRLLELYPEVPHISDSIVKVVTEMKLSYK